MNQTKREKNGLNKDNLAENKTLSKPSTGSLWEYLSLTKMLHLPTQF